MKFDIENYKGKYVMHCKTEEEAKSFCNYLHFLGKSWYGGYSYNTDNYWEHYEKDTCYNFNCGSYTNYDYYKRKKYTILEWEDFMKDNFTKADLKSGDIVVQRNGTEYMYINDYFVNNYGYIPLEDYNDNFTIPFSFPSINNGYEIVKIKRPNSGVQYCQKYWNEAPIIWERKEVEEMTLEEVCKALGKEIKIVKTK